MCSHAATILAKRTSRLFWWGEKVNGIYLLNRDERENFDRIGGKKRVITVKKKILHFSEIFVWGLVSYTIYTSFFFFKILHKSPHITLFLH